MTQLRVATHLMFQGRAADALALYGQVFADFRIVEQTLYGPHDIGPLGTIRDARIRFAGHDLMVIDSPVAHDFSFTPAMSLIVTFPAADALRRAFALLAQDGSTLMPLDDYDFAPLFGWCKDRFGMSWQLMLEKTDAALPAG